jgi:hypothetical protein
MRNDFISIFACQYKTMPRAPGSERWQGVIVVVLEKRQANPEKVTREDCYLIERAMVRVREPDANRKLLGSARERYRLANGEDAYAVYLNSFRAGHFDPWSLPDEEVALDYEFLIDQMYWRYSFSPRREEERGHAAKRILTGLGVCLGAAVLIVSISAALVTRSTGTAGAGTFLRFLCVLATSLFMGALGSGMSLNLRIQQSPASGDTILNLLLLKKARASFLFSFISGPIFAMLAYFVLASNLVDGTLFPEFPRPPYKEMPKAATVDYFVFLQPTTASDLAKLLIWCFVAGFAERLIPDTLDRLLVTKFAGIGDRLRFLVPSIPGAGDRVENHGRSSSSAAKTGEESGSDKKPTAASGVGEGPSKA